MIGVVPACFRFRYFEYCALEIRREDRSARLQGHKRHIRSCSVGCMIKHAGYKNYGRYMELIHKVLKDDGFFRLHTIGNNPSEISGDIWVDKYIFPNSMLRSIQEIGASAEGSFVVKDLHNFGTHYDNTLCAWLSNFEKNWHDLR